MILLAMLSRDFMNERSFINNDKANADSLSKLGVSKIEF